MSSSPTLEALHAAPGNPGIASLATCHPIAADDGDGLLTLARSLAAELVVIGPEAPLVAGLADEGMSVLFVSAELEEVLRLSHKVTVLRDRTVVAELPNDESLTIDRLVDTIASGASA